MIKILSHLVSSLLKKAIRIYQLSLSLMLGSCCRFYPSCSRYALLSLEKDPLRIALKKIVLRLAKCHPFHPGGEDLP